MVVTPDHEKTVEFLKWFNPGGPWQVHASGPVNGWSLTTRTFKTLSRVKAFLDEYGAKGCSLYTNVNQVMETAPKNKKPEKEDFAEIRWIHADCDPPDGEDIGAFEARMVLKFESLGRRPSLVMSSGGGVWAFYRLSKPVELAGHPGLGLGAERASHRLLRELGAGVGTHNLDRVCRLPWTLNYPSPRKKGKGRSTRLSRVIWQEDSTFPMEGFDLSSLEEMAARRSASTSSSKGEGCQITEVKNAYISPRDLPSGVPVEVINLLERGLNAYAASAEARGIKGDMPSESEIPASIARYLRNAGFDQQTAFDVLSIDPSVAIGNKHQFEEEDRNRAIRRAIDFSWNGGGSGGNGVGAVDEDGVGADWVEKMNKTHSIIKNFGGKCLIMTEYPNGDVGHQAVDHFMKAWARKKIQIQDGKNIRFSEIGKEWFNHPRAREYERAVFLPGKEADKGVFNLFRGWKTGPVKGDCSKFLTYIRNIICGEVDEYFEWLMDWTAHMFQRAWEPAEVSVALRGGQGVGKSFFPDRLGEILGPYFVAVNNQKHLTGSFNGHLKNALLVFGDEVFGSASKTVQGVLKGLVTQPYILIEPKGVDAQLWPKYLRLIMSSNDDWVVPVDIDDRRFFVLDVSHPLADDEMAKFEYFKDIKKEWDTGGKEAFLHWLLERDISGFNLRQRPRTAALEAQKLFTFTGAAKYMYAALSTGSIDAHDTDGQRIFVATRLWRESLGLDITKETALGRELQRAAGGACSNREFVKSDEGTKRRGYWLPPIQEARRLWAEAKKMTIQWPSEPNTWEACEEVF